MLSLDGDADVLAADGDRQVLALVVHTLLQSRLPDDGSLECAVGEFTVLARLFEQRVERAHQLKLVGHGPSLDGDSAVADTDAEDDAVAHRNPPSNLMLSAIPRTLLR